MAKKKKKVSVKSILKNPRAVRVRAYADPDGVVEQETLSSSHAHIGHISVIRKGVVYRYKHKIEVNTSENWLSTREDAMNDRMVEEALSGFTPIIYIPPTILDPSQSQTGGAMWDNEMLITDGSVTLQVQFPVSVERREIMEVKVYQTEQGEPCHRSWWAGVAVEIPLTGLYARRPCP